MRMSYLTLAQLNYGFDLNQIPPCNVLKQIPPIVHKFHETGKPPLNLKKYIYVFITKIYRLRKYIYF